MCKLFKVFVIVNNISTDLFSFKKTAFGAGEGKIYELYSLKCNLTKKCFGCRWKWCKNLEMKIFLRLFLLSNFLGHTKKHIELTWDIAIKSKKKSFVIYFWHCGHCPTKRTIDGKKQKKKERQRKQYWTYSLIFFPHEKNHRWWKKIAININVVFFFRLEDLSFSLLKLGLFWILMLNWAFSTTTYSISK